MHQSVIRLLTRAREVTQSAASPILTFDDLRKDLDVSSATMTNWKSRGVSKEGALEAAQKYRCDANWILTGKPQVKEAHDLSFVEPIVMPQLVTWEWVVTAKVFPERFMLAMPDGSLAGDVEKGDEMVFESGRAPRVGRPVIVEDETTEKRYVRLYAEAKEGWRAIATSDAYVSFRSDMDKIKILASLRWRG